MRSARGDVRTDRPTEADAWLDQGILVILGTRDSHMTCKMWPVFACVIIRSMQGQNSPPANIGFCSVFCRPYTWIQDLMYGDQHYFCVVGHKRMSTSSLSWSPFVSCIVLSKVSYSTVQIIRSTESLSGPPHQRFDLPISNILQMEDRLYLWASKGFGCRLLHFFDNRSRRCIHLSLQIATLINLKFSVNHLC